MLWATAEEHRSIPKDESQMEPGTNTWDFWNKLPSRAETGGSKAACWSPLHTMVCTKLAPHHSLSSLIPFPSPRSFPTEFLLFFPFPNFALTMKWKGGHVLSYILSNNNNILKLLLNELITYWMPSLDLGIKRAIKPFGPWLIITWVWY